MSVLYVLSVVCDVFFQYKLQFLPDCEDRTRPKDDEEESSDDLETCYRKSNRSQSHELVQKLNYARGIDKCQKSARECSELTP